MNPVWREHLEALERSNLCDARRLRDQPENFARALQWLSEAWELAAKYSEPRDPTRLREERFERLVQLRRSLERARLSS